MSIDEVLTALDKLPGAKVGYGPKHPLTPERVYGNVLLKHLEQYPFLYSHQDFVAFLERCAGAWINRDETPKSSWWHTTMFGIGEWEQAELADPVDHAGFYVFATTNTGPSDDPALDDKQAAYAFDATGTRPNVVFVNVSPTDHPESGCYRPYCPTFADWLRHLIESDGRLMPASEDPEPVSTIRA